MKRFNDYLLQRGYSAETIRRINQTLSRFKDWLKKNNSDVYLVNHRTCISYIDYLRKRHNYKPITINLKLAQLSHYYNYLSVRKNPFENLRVRGEKKKIKRGYLSEDELLSIYYHLPEESQLDIRVKVLAGFYLFQGVSTRDILHLKVKHLDLEKGVVMIPHTRRGNQRTLRLNPIQGVLLKSVFGSSEYDSDELIYQTIAEGKQDKWVIKHLHQKLQSHMDYKTLNEVRYSVIRNWLKRHNLREVQYMAGHRYITTTEKFLGSNIQELRESIVLKHPMG